LIVKAIPALLPAMNEIAALIDQRLDRLLVVPDDPRKRLLEAMRHASIGGGKRMRPMLAIAACDLFQVDRECAIRVAMAVELVHCYSLVHDDLPCMDDDDLRRGRPTVHKAFDEATAVLAGDALLTLAFELLAHPSTHEDPYVRCELITELAKAAGSNGMVGGQAMDMAAESQAFDLPTTTRLQQMKTGALIGFAVESGGIMGKAGHDARTQLKGYARDMGLAFQIADDLMDIGSSEARTGKRVGKDMAAGKSTLVSLMGTERARAQGLILVEQAIAHLNSFDSKADLLRMIARFAVERES
jgi:farnesyl diphosphate synthase